MENIDIYLIFIFSIIISLHKMIAELIKQTWFLINTYYSSTRHQEIIFLFETNCSLQILTIDQPKTCMQLNFYPPPNKLIDY